MVCIWCREEANRVAILQDMCYTFKCHHCGCEFMIEIIKKGHL